MCIKENDDQSYLILSYLILSVISMNIFTGHFLLCMDAVTLILHVVLSFYRDCPETLCECHRTDKRLSAAEEKKLLQKTSAPTSTRKATGKPQVAYDPRDKSWKNKATIKPKPVSLQEPRLMNYDPTSLTFHQYNEKIAYML